MKFRSLLTAAAMAASLAVPATAAAKPKAHASAYLHEYEAVSSHQRRQNARCGDSLSWICYNKYSEPAHVVERINPIRIRTTGVIEEQNVWSPWTHRLNRLTWDWGICTDGSVCLISVINGY